ncbi:hypothetical protein GCM10010862_08080 [Devosia nitrariae]|uniref:Uncharacterized protein n=1 Tax=Devosia nitrariae TaxID=2071872 RepID=A0ABQ5W167_9HYPH|nr:hypothetical protein GCM10010862_08080 [Devosia nitrariae]
MKDALRITDEADARRPEQESGGEIAKDRAEAEPLEHRHGKHGCGQQHDDGDEVDLAMRGIGGMGSGFDRVRKGFWVH